MEFSRSSGKGFSLFDDSRIEQPGRKWSYGVGDSAFFFFTGVLDTMQYCMSRAIKGF
jgi:hypothetical protein